MDFSSFLVRDGRAIRPDLHRKRLGGIPDLSDIPKAGQWFPKLTADSVELRPAPPLRTSTVLWIPEDPDPRRHPLRKGPDTAVLGRLRSQARDEGADDAVLHADGYVREAANAALVFFDESGPVQAPESEVLASTTVQGTVEAGLMPAPRRRNITLEEAFTLPALAASALHGWTPVHAWVVQGRGMKAASLSIDAAGLNAALWAQAERI